MAQRDLGTAVLNIKIIFQKLNQKDIKEKLAKTLENLEKVFEKSAATALKNAQKTSKTIEIAENLGKDIVAGLISGIKEKQESLESTVMKMNKAVLTAVLTFFGIKSPSRVFHQIGLDVVQGFINGVNGNKQQVNNIMQNLASGAKSAFSDEITNLERDLRKVLSRIQKLMLEEQKAIAGGGALSPKKQFRLDELKSQAFNIQEAIRVAQARAARDPNFKIEEVGKRRAGEIERNTVKLEKQSSAIRKLAGSLSELERTFIKSDGKIKSFGTAVDAAGEKFTKYLIAVVKANKETMTSEQLTNLLAQEKAKLAAAIQASVKNSQLAASMTNRLAQAEKTANELATQAAEKKSAALQKQASDIAKLASKQKTLITAFNQTNKTAQDQENIIDASRAAYDKFFATKVRLNAKLKDEKTLVHDINVAFNQMARELKATIPQGKLLTDLLNELIKSGKGAIAQVRGIGLKDTLTKIGARIPTSDRSTLMGDRATLEELMKSSKLSKNQIQDLEKMLARVNVAIKRIDQNNLANIRKGIHSLTSGVNQFGEQLRRVSFILRDVGRQMMMMGRRGFSVAATSFNDFMEFEQAVVDILAVTGELNAGFEKTGAVSNELGKFILDLAGKTRFSAKEIADSGRTLALAGFTTEQIMGALKSMASLAAATGSELANTTTLIVSTISTFGVEAEKASKVADIFAAAVTKSNMSVIQLTEAMKIVAPSAAAMNQDISQTAAALGILANAGLRGTMAGTGLARVLTQLVEKSDALDSMLQGLGSSFDRINPEQVGIVEIIKEFERLNLSTAQLLEIFDLRAFRALQAILAQGSDDLARLNDELESAAGLAEFLSRNRLTTLSASVELLSDAIAALRIQLGDLVSGELKQLIRFVTSVVDTIRVAVASNQEAVKSITKAILGFIVVLTTLGTTLFTTGAAFAFASAPIIAVGAALAGINSLVATTATLLPIMGLGITALLPALLAMAGAFIAVSTAIATATSAILFTVGALSVGLFQNFDLTFLYLKQWISDILTFVGDFVSDFTTGWNSGFDAFRDSFEGVLSSLTNLGMEVSETFGGSFAESIGSVLVNSFTMALQTLKQFIDVLASAKDLIVGSITAVNDFSKNIVALANNAFSFIVSVLSNLGGIVLSFSSSLLSILPTFGTFVKWATLVVAALAGPAGISWAISLVVLAIGTLGKALIVFLASNPFLLIAGAIAAAILLLDKFFFKFSEGLAKAQADLDKAIRDFTRLQESLRKLADESFSLSSIDVKIATTSSEAALTQLENRLAILKSASTADSKELGQVLSSDDQTELRNKVAKQVAELTNLRDKLQVKAKNALELGTPEEYKKYEGLLAALNGQIERLNSSYSEYARQLTAVSLAFDGNTDSIREAINAEEQRYSKLNDLVADFNKTAGLISDETSFDALKTTLFDANGKITGTQFFGALEDVTLLVSQLNEQMGTDFKLETWSDFQDIVEYLAKNGKEALETSRGLLGQLKVAEVLSIEQGGIDLSTEEGRAKRDKILADSRTYLDIAKQQSKESQHMKDLEEIRVELSQAGLTEQEKSLAALDSEISKRSKIVEDQKRYLEIQQRILENELQNSSLTEKQREAKEDALTRTKAEYKAMVKMSDELSEADAKRREEFIKEKRAAGERAIDELQLETETDIQKRIEIRSKIIRENRQKELQKAKDDLKGFLGGEDLRAAEARLDELSRLAEEKDIKAVVDEETKDKDKEVNKVVDKRLDLESELLSTLGKQVTTLQQMAALMQFIEALQRRKDRRALQDLRDIAKVKDKIARAEKMAALDGEKGAKGLNAMENLNAELALRMGMMQRNMGMAGVPQVVLNPNAMVNELIIAIRDLTNVIKDFRIGDMAAGIIPGGLNIGAGNRLVGANFGTINHIDNSNKTVNIKTDNPEVAKALAGMKV